MLIILVVKSSTKSVGVRVSKVSFYSPVVSDSLGWINLTIQAMDVGCLNGGSVRGSRRLTYIGNRIAETGKAYVGGQRLGGV